MNRKTFDLKTVMMYSIAAYKQNGDSYNNTSGLQSNKNIIMSYLGILDDSRASFVDHITEECEEITDKIIQYYKGLTFKAMGNKINGFEQRVLDIIQSGVVDRRDLGIIASLPKSYFRAIRRDVTDMQLRQLSTSSKHLGKEGDEVQGIIKVLHCSFIQKLQCYVVNATLGEDIVVFFTKHAADHWGESCTIKAKVKRHQTSKFHKGKETVINYVKVVS